MAVYDSYAGTNSVTRDGYEAEMSFFNPVSLDWQKRTRTFPEVNYAHANGVEDELFRSAAQAYVTASGELEGYYLVDAVVRRVDIMHFLPSPDTSI
ncbi:hypothetical protein ACPYPG_08185 [Streptomyces sp. FR-108]|uniref:hypothetical protein n=1 Tax=Streptomyces sp. FR-108 TaxID=3416665 RepID=UPI003CF3FFB6